ncbi:MAG TPA: hypothetical protein PLZ77_05590 [Lachnospiraceae bacterium]|nr:hypothetical protein [Lachnospiraceae bacterium]
MKREEIKKIDFYCKICKRTFKAFHMITGEDNTPVMENFGMSCHHCTRVVTLKKKTERELLEQSKNGIFYV